MSGEGYAGVPIWLLVILAVAIGLFGCGSGSDAGGGLHLIEGDDSFAGMPNGGSLAEAIERLGAPDEMFSPDSEDSHECIAHWREAGVFAQFINWGALSSGAGPPCQPQVELTLIGATMHGDWETDSGLRIGDSVEKVDELYDPGAAGTCGAGFLKLRTPARMLRRVSDPLGGPGAYIGTLGVMTSSGEVTGFVMSSRAVSE